MIRRHLPAPFSADWLTVPLSLSLFGGFSTVISMLRQQQQQEGTATLSVLSSKLTSCTVEGCCFTRELTACSSSELWLLSSQETLHFYFLSHNFCSDGCSA